MQKTIVIVDDDLCLLDVLKLIFKRAGFSITAFSEGHPLLEKHDVPDIYLLDKQLSGMDGLDICRHLKGQPGTKEVPVVMISATPGIGKMAKDAGAADFIEKPFNVTELIQRMENILKKYEPVVKEG